MPYYLIFNFKSERKELGPLQPNDPRKDTESKDIIHAASNIANRINITSNDCHCFVKYRAPV